MSDTVQKKLAMFGGHTMGVMRTLSKNFSEHTTATRPYLEMCAEALKNCYPDLYGDDEEFDLMKALEDDTLGNKEVSPSVSWPLLTIGHLTSYMIHMKENQDKEFSVAAGDRQGMLAATAAAASNNDEEFRANTVNAIRAAVIAGKTKSQADLVESWNKTGVSFPTGDQMRIPVLSENRDLRDSKSIAQELAAAVMSNKIPEVASTYNVVDLSCPESKMGQIALPLDGVRDLDTVIEQLPDVAKIRREVQKNGYSIDVSLPLSFFWLFHDLAINAAVLYAAVLLEPFLNTVPYFKWIVFWPLFSVVFGTTLTGLWVIGHECGHRAFAGAKSNDWINDVVGFMTHTPLLVPFWAWRYSHHKHHSFTNHLLDGETHVPNHKNGAKMDHTVWKIIGEDAFVFWNVFQHLVFGVEYQILSTAMRWLQSNTVTINNHRWPLYLVQNATGGRRTPQGEKINRKKSISHFSSKSQIFQDNQRNMILPGTLGCVAWLAVLAYIDYQFGFGTTMFYFWGAYTVTNGWLVLYTWLHHTDKEIPQFGDGHFTYMRGATCSIDRSYPAIINYVHHHIGSTHVLHHISFQLPHYRAENATKVFRETWPQFYRFDKRPLLEVIMDVSGSCHYVDSIEGVQYYKSLKTLDSQKKKCN